MPTHLRRKVIIAAVVALLISVGICVLTSSIVAAVIVATLLVGFWGSIRTATGSSFSPVQLSLWATAGLLVVAGTTWVDSSWVSGLLAALAVAGVAVLWQLTASRVGPGEALSPDTLRALSLVGVTVSADNRAAGWSTGLTQRGVVVMVREIAPGTGPVEKWKSVKSLNSSVLNSSVLGSVREGLVAQGISPVMLAVARGTAGVLLQGPNLTVASLDKLSTAIKSAKPGLTDPVAMAREAGFQVSRAAARQVERRSTATTKSGSKIVHKGRVTEKRP
jgi:hypothetical protein